MHHVRGVLCHAGGGWLNSSTVHGRQSTAEEESLTLCSREILMGHLHTDIVVRGTKAEAELKEVLIDTGATFTVLPQGIIDEVGASRIPGESEVELGDGKKVIAKAYGVRIRIKDAEAPCIVITFEGAKTVVGVETLESIGIRLDPTTGNLEFTRPKGMAYFY